MNWSVKNMHELAGLSENDKLVLMSDTGLAIFRHWQVWVGIAFVYLCGYVGGCFANVAGAAVGGGIGGLVCGPIVLRMQAHEIRKAVAKRQAASAPQYRTAEAAPNSAPRH